jgi:hypothetical protein
LVGQGTGFEKLGQVFVSFAFGVAGHCLRCSWCCLGGTAIHYHLANHFNFPIIHCQQKIQCVTGQSGRGYVSASARTIYLPGWREKPYI